MKKFILATLLSLVLATHAYALDICATIFPIYDWVRVITNGTGANVNLILDNGVDLHSFSPTVDDIVRISTCDVFIYVGGESDEWVDDALKNVTNKNQIAVNLLDVLGDLVKSEETVEGMQAEDEHDDHEHEDDEPDEHVWLSLRNSQSICKYISEKLSEYDPEHKDIYVSNASGYIEKLSELDSAYREVVASSSRKVLLFADRFPFRYMVDDYGLRYYAAFSGCSAETEASFETVKFLSEKTNELNLPCVIKIDGTRHKIPETVAGKRNILVMNSMQSTTMNDIINGETYLGVMKRNLDVLKEALN